MSAPRTTRRRLTLVVAVCALALAAGGVFGMLSSLTARPGAHAVLDMRGDPVALDPGTLPAPAVQKAMHATSDIGERLVVPSVGLNVPLGALNVVDGTITPPGFTSAYWIRNLGVGLQNAGTGTVFIAMHSVRGGGLAPGNYLIDVDRQKAKVAPGATIEVGGLTYTVTGSQAIAKTTIATDSSVWADIPGRLVLITCLQLPDPDTPSIDNMVITATRLPT